MPCVYSIPHGIVVHCKPAAVDHSMGSKKQLDEAEICSETNGMYLKDLENSLLTVLQWDILRYLVCLHRLMVALEWFGRPSHGFAKSFLLQRWQQLRTCYCVSIFKKMYGEGPPTFLMAASRDILCILFILSLYCIPKCTHKNNFIHYDNIYISSRYNIYILHYIL